MCGIAGELRFNSVKEQANWDAISELMRQRGPDDLGSWHNDCCSLVFRRLSILDLSAAGHQPMISVNGRYVLLYNGEVYNFQSLRKKLRQRGINFRSNTDTEVVLYSLIEWGCEKALDYFNGMFVLALFDTQEKTLFLARDHAGIKPLYWMCSNDGVMFASQYDQILAHPWSKDLLFSPEAATLYLWLASIPAPLGILTNTYMLEPGSWLKVSYDGHIDKGYYYQFTYKNKPSLSGQQALEAVDEAITSAVKRHLVSDVPIGAFLSGGIDSPLVCAKIKAVSNLKMRAFTIGCPGDVNDESQDAINYAKKLNIEQTVRNVSADDAIMLLDDVIKCCGEPFGDYSIFPTMLVSKLAREEFTVMLSGDGGDELFWGYANRFRSIMAYAQDFKRPWYLRQLSRIPRRILGLAQPPGNCHKSIGHWQRDKHSRLPKFWLHRIFPNMPDWPREYIDFDYNGYDLDETARWIRWNEFRSHLSGVLLKVDRASMYNSLEVRVPLLDREVIEVASQVNWKDCFDMKKRIGKIPLRASLSRYLDYQTTAKKGFAPPMGQWLRTSLREIVEEKLLTRDSLGGIAVNRKEMKAMYKAHLNGKEMGWGIWPLLSLALWHDHFQR